MAQFNAHLKSCLFDAPITVNCNGMQILTRNKENIIIYIFTLMKFHPIYEEEVSNVRTITVSVTTITVSVTTTVV